MIIKITHRDLRALGWIRDRVASWRFQFKVYRKYSAVPGANFTQEEQDALTALKDIEVAVGKLLKQKNYRK